MALNPHENIEKAKHFAESLGAEAPILLGPMAGACPVSLSVAVAHGEGVGACGALLMQPKAILDWTSEFRTQCDGPFQLNLWIPDATPKRNIDPEQQLRTFLSNWGPETPPDFAAQCDALLDAKPNAISSIMGVYESDFVSRMKDRGIKWIANASTVGEAKQAEAAGADIIVAKGVEAGGHSGAFNPDDGLRQAVGLMSLIPAIADAVELPIVATGGIADARTAMAALTLGASAVQIGTGFLRAPEAKIAPAWAGALGTAVPERTLLTRAFSGRYGRSIATKYAIAMETEDAPAPAPYPIQRVLTQTMRDQATKEDNIDCIQAWAGQSAGLAKNRPATEITRDLWEEMQNF